MDNSHLRNRKVKKKVPFSHVRRLAFFQQRIANLQTSLALEIGAL